ncbi:ankyrin repeat domain-containing protein [Pseudomonas sp. PLMAX]|uniref:ankyrin repeat domain-containing protein n=1 Tax=Pseudomonas sp. PLMAX TaxID=2201998 RepID=UPI0038B96C40
MNTNVIPLDIMRWANEEWVSRFTNEAGTPISSMLTADPNQRVSDLGSRMLHLATMCPHRPSKEVTKSVIRYLLVERNADVNVVDDYGRTPLTHFVTGGQLGWRGDEQFGCDVLELLLAHGADANALFTPDFVGLAGCDKWTLAHFLNNEGFGRSELPLRMRQILEPHFDRSICDSAGRNAERTQLVLEV